MIVYVETNFLLELAYLQESSESCEEILRLAKSGLISLVAYSLSPQDALVLASVKSHSELRGGPQCFVSKDRGFVKQKIREELRSERGECKVIFNFDDTLAHIKNALRPEAES